MNQPRSPATPTPGPITCHICGKTGLSSVGTGSKYKHNILNCVLEMAAERDRLVAALTPCVETKRAYMGEFSYGAEQIDEDGNPQPVTYYVPWTTIKEIMATILAKARKP